MSVLLDTAVNGLDCAEAILEMKAYHEEVVRIGYGVISALLAALGIVWLRLTKKEVEIKEEKSFLKKEYKENIIIFVEFKGLLSSLVKGIDTDIPKEFVNLKAHTEEKINSLHGKLKSIIKNGGADKE